MHFHQWKRREVISLLRCAAAEWLAEFRTDVEALLTRKAVEACVSLDVRERAPMQSVRYYGFVDPSGGRANAMTLAVGHREDDVVVVDALRERRPPFSPEDVVAEFATLLKTYHISRSRATATPASGRPSAFASTASVTSPRKNQSPTSTATCCPPSTRAGSTCSTTQDCCLSSWAWSGEPRAAAARPRARRARRPGERGGRLSGRRQARGVRQLPELGERP
jgi:hypothetical protein